MAQKRSSRRNSVLAYVVPAIVILLVAIGAYIVFARQREQTNQSSNSVTFTVRRGDVAPVLSLTGQVVAAKTVNLAFETGGTIKEVAVSVGDTVKKGQFLAAIDATDLERQVEIAKANYDSALAQYEQAKAGTPASQLKVQEINVTYALKALNKAKDQLSQLQRDPSATPSAIASAQDAVDKAQQQYETSLAQLQASKAGPTSYELKSKLGAVTQAKYNYEQALANLSKAKLYAPMAGTVLQVNGEVGETVNAGISSSARTQTSGASGSTGSTSGSSSGSSTSAFIVIADLTRLEVSAAVDQVDIVNLSVGQKVKITFDALPDMEFTGNVRYIDPNPTNSQNVITYPVTVTIDNPDRRLRPGMAANLEIELDKRTNVLVVPNLAVRVQSGKKVVTKIVDGAPTDVPVVTGISDDRYTEIVSGLVEGDVVVVNAISTTAGQNGTGTNQQRFRGGPGMGMF